MQVQPGSGFPMLDPKSGAQVYYGEKSDVPYLVVDTKQPELNYQTGPAQNTMHYPGKGGIPIGGFFRRLVFAYRYRDFNLLISGLIGSKSRIMINRNITTRIEKIAPFLKYDARSLRRDRERPARLHPRRVHDHRPLSLLGPAAAAVRDEQRPPGRPARSTTSGTR